MSMFSEWSKRQKVILIDGSMAVGLEEQGLDLNHRLWTAKAIVEAPHKIQAVHEAYFNAGANITITASYQASMKGFLELGYSEAESVHFLENTVALAQAARESSESNQEKWIAGSIGPYGAYLADGSEYRGNYNVSRNFLKEFHEERLQVLVKAQVDLLAIETIPDKTELLVLLELIKDFPEVPAWVSFTLKDEKHISDGTSLVEMQGLLEQQPQVLAYGINCVAPNLVEPALLTLKKQAKKPLVAYPNSGAIYNPVSKVWTETTHVHDVFTNQAKNWYAHGCTWIGGCCCTSSTEIDLLRETFPE